MRDNGQYGAVNAAAPDGRPSSFASHLAGIAAAPAAVNEPSSEAFANLGSPDTGPPGLGEGGSVRQGSLSNFWLWISTASGSPARARAQWLSARLAFRCGRLSGALAFKSIAALCMHPEVSISKAQGVVRNAAGAVSGGPLRVAVASGRANATIGALLTKIGRVTLFIGLSFASKASVAKTDAMVTSCDCGGTDTCAAGKILCAEIRICNDLVPILDAYAQAAITTAQDLDYLLSEYSLAKTDEGRVRIYMRILELLTFWDALVSELYAIEMYIQTQLAIMSMPR